MAFVIVGHNHNDNTAHYYRGFENGGYVFGDVTEAKRFTEEELLLFLKDNLSFWSLGCSFVSIAECTFERLEQAKKDILSHKAVKNIEYWNLWKNYCSYLYVAR